MKKKRILFCILLAVLGVGMLCYPMASDFVSQRHSRYTIAELQAQLIHADIAKQRRLAQEYNTAKNSKDYEHALNIADGMMGSIEIPKIRVKLPIYHGTGEEVLAKGLGHLPQSDLPVGGTGNHTVLTGHTGLPNAKLLTDLTKLEEGDVFCLFVLGERLVYEIDQIVVVAPEESEALAPVPGEDYCTLVTCTPYGINSHRLLVRGHRTELPADAVQNLFWMKIRQQVIDCLNQLLLLAVTLPAIIAALLLTAMKIRLTQNAL